MGLTIVEDSKKEAVKGEEVLTVRTGPPEMNEEYWANAMGGTELMKYGLLDRLDPKYKDKVQIICSRVREIDPDKPTILWLHDLPNDPESARLNEEEFRAQFERIVCVSDWQMQQYNMIKQLPYNESEVLKNAIVPFPNTEKDFSDGIKLIYHSTPHRGLELLYPVFDELCKKHDNITLDVYSSFNLYGWPQRDEPYKDLFDKLESHPKINYHGSQPNEVVREALQKAHIFAYPSIWPETSCICLMEAMSAGLVCVHPNLAALPETAAQLTYQYQWTEDANKHCAVLYHNLDSAIQNVQSADTKGMLVNQKVYADNFYNWNTRVKQWEMLIENVIYQYEERKKNGDSLEETTKEA
jgi:glycosyltransferase involved in cell wall biosynthesis